MTDSTKVTGAQYLCASSRRHRRVPGVTLYRYPNQNGRLASQYDNPERTEHRSKLGGGKSLGNTSRCQTSASRQKGRHFITFVREALNLLRRPQRRKFLLYIYVKIIYWLSSYRYQESHTTRIRQCCVAEDGLIILA